MKHEGYNHKRLENDEHSMFGNSIGTMSRTQGRSIHMPSSPGVCIEAVAPQSTWQRREQRYGKLSLKNLAKPGAHRTPRVRAKETVVPAGAARLNYFTQSDDHFPLMRWSSWTTTNISRRMGSVNRNPSRPEESENSDKGAAGAWGHGSNDQPPQTTRASCEGATLLLHSRNGAE